VLCFSALDWSNLYDLYLIFCGPLFVWLHPVLASSFLLRQDFLNRAIFLILCVGWFYKKAVWSVVKSWEFEGNLRCSKITRIRRKNPMKWVLSISRDYWVYLDMTLQSFKIWEFWGEFWGIETFVLSKFSPATGVRVVSVRQSSLSLSQHSWDRISRSQSNKKLVWYSKQTQVRKFEVWVCGLTRETLNEFPTLNLSGSNNL